MEFKTGQIIVITIGAYSDATTYDVEILRDFNKQDILVAIGLIKDKLEQVSDWRTFEDIMLLFYLEHKRFIKLLTKEYDGWIQLHYEDVSCGDSHNKCEFYDEEKEFIKEYF